MVERIKGRSTFPRPKGNLKYYIFISGKSECYSLLCTQPKFSTESLEESSCLSLFCSIQWNERFLRSAFYGVLRRILFKRFYLFIFREREGERKRERNINVWLPLTHPALGTWPTTQAHSLTGNRTSNSLVCRLVLNPLHHTSQGLRRILFLLALYMLYPSFPFYFNFYSKVHTSL